MNSLTLDQVLALTSNTSPAGGDSVAIAEAPPTSKGKGPGLGGMAASATIGYVIGWFVLVGVAFILGHIAKEG